MGAQLAARHVLVLDEGEELAAALAGRGAAVRVTRGPFRFDEGPARVVESARSDMGGLDAIVTVCPAVSLRALDDLEPEEWKERFRGFVEEPFLLVQAWLRHVLGRGVPGRWVAVTSVLGTQPFPLGGAVGAAAAALHTLVRIAAVEYGPSGVRANAVAVGWREGAVPPELGSDGADIAVADTPARRLARVDDVTAAVAWLLSPQAEYVNGEILRLDGGYSLTRSGRAAPSASAERRLLEERWWGATG